MNIGEVDSIESELIWFIGLYLKRPNIRMKDSMRISRSRLLEGKTITQKQFDHLIPFLKISTGMETTELMDRYKSVLLGSRETEDRPTLEEFFV